MTKKKKKNTELYLYKVKKKKKKELVVMMRNTKSHDSPPADVSRGTPGRVPGTPLK